MKNMKNFKSLVSIILAIFGLASFSSCNKNITCECDVENSPDVKVYIDINGGKCEDVDGNFEYEYYGMIYADYDIEDCKED